MLSESVETGVREIARHVSIYMQQLVDDAPSATQSMVREALKLPPRPRPYGSQSREGLPVQNEDSGDALHGNDDDGGNGSDSSSSDTASEGEAAALRSIHHAVSVFTRSLSAIEPHLTTATTGPLLLSPALVTDHMRRRETTLRYLYI